MDNKHYTVLSSLINSHEDIKMKDIMLNLDIPLSHEIGNLLDDVDDLFMLDNDIHFNITGL